MKKFPLNKAKVYITNDSNSFVSIDYDKETEIPINGHLGAFGTQRKYHCHEGVDLYCNEGDSVYAIEDGEVILIEDFTGKKANSDWWNDTKAVHIKGTSGIINYGEITPVDTIHEGQDIKSGDLIGYVATVLKNDKGRPMNMLHLELYEPEFGNNRGVTWNIGEPKPKYLKDPTELLKSCSLSFGCCIMKKKEQRELINEWRYKDKPPCYTKGKVNFPLCKGDELALYLNKCDTCNLYEKNFKSGS